MKKLIAFIALACGLAAAPTTPINNANIQLNGVPQTGVLAGNTTGAATATQAQISTALDLIGSTRGSLLYKGAAGWSALTPGTSGQVLSTAGAGADPLWTTDAGGDVIGPVSSTLNALALFADTTGKLLKNSDLTYSGTTLSVPDAFVVSSAGSIGLTAGGSNKSVTVTPSGTGGLSLLFPSTGGLGVGVASDVTGGRINVLSRSATTTPTFATWAATNDGFATYAEASSGLNLSVAAASARATINFRRARGTLSTPTVVSSGDNLGNIFTSGWDGAGFNGGTGIETLVDGTVSSGFVPAELDLQTSSTTVGRALNLRLRGSGSLELGITANSNAAWGVSGINLNVRNRTITDSSSSGTVATAVANSFAVPTFAASSSTTFTKGANVYIAGAPAAGTNVSFTDSYGLLNLGRTRLEANLDVSHSTSGTSSAAFTNTNSGGYGILGRGGSTLASTQYNLRVADYNNVASFLVYGDTIQVPSTVTAGLQLYNTADQVTNYERLEFNWSSNIARIRTLKAGSGSARALSIGTDSTEAINISTAQFVNVGPTGTANSRLTVSDNYRNITSGVSTATLASTDSFAIDKGGTLQFSGSYTGTTQTTFAGLLGAKENGTDNNTAGYLAFYTRPAGGAMTRRGGFSSAGVFDISGSFTLGGNLTFGTSASILNGTTGSIGLTATGTNQSITLAPSGTGTVVFQNLRSTAGQNLVLGTGTYGAAMSFTSATGAVSMAPTLNVQSGASFNSAVAAADTTSTAILNLRVGVITTSPSNSTDTWVAVHNTGGPGINAGDLLLIPRSSSAVPSAVRLFSHTTGVIANTFTHNAAGNTLLGTTTDSSNGKLQLASHTTSAGGIGFGTDVTLYRGAAGALTSGGQFITAAGGIYANGASSTFDAIAVSTDLVLTLRTLTAGATSSRGLITNKALTGVMEFTSDAGGNGSARGFDFKTLTTSRLTINASGDTALSSTTEATTGGAGSLTTAGGIYAAKKIITASTITALGGATFLTTSSALTDGAGAGAGTITNAPSAGNPTKWIGINDNGTTRYVPAW